ncbi:MAG TPA: CRTAC1 family protein [Terracidiphilus sp.]|nr:CRTAC1 family protein [Terracidiphilus sp.]
MVAVQFRTLVLAACWFLTLSGARVSAQNTVSTGGAQKPRYDAQGRVITAGGFVESGPVIFQDVTLAAGLGNWRHVMGGPEKTFILESNGSGVALFDYDNDGWPDIYLVNGSTFPALAGKEAPPHAALFHNNHDGTFTDVATQAGVTNDRWGFGVTIGDYDNDGWPDIFVANYGKNRLYHNNRDGTFSDVAEKAGVALGNWSAGASWGDYDGDGLLDLFVSGYVHFDLNRLPYPKSEVVGYADCGFRGINGLTCGPRGLEGEPDHLFHNNGDGTFTDVSVKAGVADEKNKYYGLTAIFADVDDDGRPDLLVGNDSTPNYLYRNRGNGTFSDDSYSSGFAFNKDGREVASMGLGIGSYLNNGRADVALTNFSDDFKVLYRNDGDTSFTDVSNRVGIADISIPFLSWGVGLIDYDNDSWNDLFIVNGHVFPIADKSGWGSTYAQRPLLFHNTHGGKFDYVPPVVNTGLAVLLSGRGAAFGDLFNDGKIDVVMTPVDGSAVLLRNVNPDHHHWVELKLVGGKGSPRDAVGAKVFLKANGTRMRQDVLSSGSYISSNDKRAHFGLGDATVAGTAEIHWPTGHVEFVRLPAVDKIYTVTESKGITDILCTKEPCKIRKPAAR